MSAFDTYAFVKELRSADLSEEQSETALDHPAARQEHEAFFCGGQLDDCQRDPRLGGIPSGLRARIALIAKGDLDRLTSCGLDLGC